VACDGSSAACWTDEDVDPCQRKEQVTPRRRWPLIGDRTDSVLVRQAATGNLELGADIGGGDQTVVTDLDEANGQDMKQESANELDGVDSDRVPVLGAEADVVSVEADETLVRKTDTKTCSGPPKGRLA
jgi:hypothetical protein